MVGQYFRRLTLGPHLYDDVMSIISPRPETSVICPSPDKGTGQMSAALGCSAVPTL